MGVCFEWVEVCHYGMVYLNPFSCQFLGSFVCGSEVLLSFSVCLLLFPPLTVCGGGFFINVVLFEGTLNDRV